MQGHATGHAPAAGETPDVHPFGVDGKLLTQVVHGVEREHRAIEDVAPVPGIARSDRHQPALRQQRQPVAAREATIARAEPHEQAESFIRSFAVWHEQIEGLDLDVQLPLARVSFTQLLQRNAHPPRLIANVAQRMPLREDDLRVPRRGRGRKIGGRRVLGEHQRGEQQHRAPATDRTGVEHLRPPRTGASR